MVSLSCLKTASPICDGQLVWLHLNAETALYSLAPRTTCFSLTDLPKPSATCICMPHEWPHNLALSGAATIPDIASYLSASSTLRKLKNACTRQTNTHSTQSSHRLIGVVCSSDLAEEKFKKRTQLAQFVGRSVYFAVLPAIGAELISLQWLRDWRGKVTWHVRLVSVQDVNLAFSIELSVGDEWLPVLCQLVDRPIRPLLRCLGFASSGRAEGIRDELLKRLSQFGKDLNAFYFQNVKFALAWDVAEHWAAWEYRKTSQYNRRNQINRRWGVNLTEEDFQKLMPNETLSVLGHTTLGFPPPSWEPRAKRTVLLALQDGRDVAHPPDRKMAFNRAPFPFSRGGYFNEYFCRESGPVLHRMPYKQNSMNEETLSTLLWWWNSIGSWPDQLRDEFHDNWERGAWFYELRARLLPDRTWDLFDGNWFDLDVSQRGVIYYLWPPQPYGKHWRSGQRIWGDTIAEHEFRQNKVIVDPLATEFQQRAKLNEVDPFWKHHLMGLEPAKSKIGRIKGEHLPWNLIEALDRRHYFGKPLDNVHIKANGRAKKIYEATCAEAGLPPFKAIKP